MPSPGAVVTAGTMGEGRSSPAAACLTRIVFLPFNPRTPLNMSLAPGTRVGPYEIVSPWVPAAWERSTRPAIRVSIER